MSAFTVLATLLLFGPDAFTMPVYPPNALGGGTVIAQLRAGSGDATRVDIVSGQEPFASVAKAALQNWNLSSEKDRSNLVIVHFRQPNIYYLGDGGEQISCAGADESLPCPNYIVGPAYPAQAAAQGSVILRIEVGDDGGIRGVRTIQGMGIFTMASEDAVHKWRFSPALDERGMKKESHAYAVFVYRFPVIQPQE